MNLLNFNTMEHPEQPRVTTEDCELSNIPSERLQSPEYVNYYDNNIDQLKHLKRELLSEEENHESSSSFFRSDLLFEDEELLEVERMTYKSQNNNTDESLILNGKVKREKKYHQDILKTEKLEDHEETNNKYYVTIKTERLEDQEILDNSRDSSVHYDVLVTPKRVECKRCGRPFKNNYNLLKHNIEHLKLDISIPYHNKKQRLKCKNPKMIKINETEGSFKCNYCDKAFKRDTIMQIHMKTVHSKRNYYCDLCGKHFRCMQYLRTHMQSIHLPEMRANSLKCKYCDVVLKHKYNLHCHMKTLHNNETFKCGTCDAVFKCKQYLISHCKRMHYNYGRMFACRWCYKEFRTPFHLHDHTKRLHVDLVKRLKAGMADIKS